MTDSASSIDRFIDALWIEDGLSAQTLAAYRRDLSLYAQWLAAQDGRAIEATRESDLLAYMAERHAITRAATANRRLSVFKRFCRWALREKLIDADPTLKLQAARQPLRVPKTLSEAQVEALLAAPDTATPLGLRDRTMIELMYASGLRVSELVSLKTVYLSLDEGALRVTGKGAKERLVPFGAEAHAWVRRYLAEARSAILKGQASDALFVTARGAADDAADVLEADQGACAEGRHSRTAVAAHAAPCLCHASAEPRCRPARGADAAGPCRHLHHHHLHPCGSRAAEGAACAASSSWMTSDVDA